MNHSSKIFEGKTAFYGIYWLVVICFTIVFFAFPKAYDDWWYSMEHLYYGVDADGHHNLWMGIKGSLMYHWTYDNVRFANYLGSIFLLVPRVVPSTVVSACFALGYWLMIKLAGLRPGQTARLVLLTVMLVFLLPWHERMFSEMYAFNYVVTMPILLGAIYIFIHKVKVRPVWGFVLSFVLGICHESYSVAALAGLSALLIFRVLPATRLRTVMIIANALGLLIILLPPAVWNRSGMAHRLILESSLIWLTTIVLFVVATSFVLFRPRLRRMALEPLQVVTIVASIILLTVAYFTGIVRSAFPAMLLCMCSLTVYAAAIFRPSFWVKVIFSLVGFVVLAVHMIIVDIETIKIRPVADAVNHQVQLHIDEPGAIFAKIRYPWQTSPLSLGKPDSDILMPRSYYYLYFRVFLHNYTFMIVPDELREYKRGDGEILEGGTNCRIWNGHIVSPNLTDTVYSRTEIIFGRRVENVGLQSVVFKNSRGEEFVYIVPDRSTVSHFLGDPQSFRFL